jgi:hypothetical protein
VFLYLLTVLTVINKYNNYTYRTYNTEDRNIKCRELNISAEVLGRTKQLFTGASDGREEHCRWRKRS